MAADNPLLLLPSDSEMTTQQAADRLEEVPMSFLDRLLDEGVIPFREVGGHRRILLEDLLACQADQQMIRTERLQFLATQAQDLNLGYE